MKIGLEEKTIQDAKEKLNELERKKNDINPNKINYQLEILQRELKVLVHNKEVQILLEA